MGDARLPVPKIRLRVLTAKVEFQFSARETRGFNMDFGFFNMGSSGFQHDFSETL
jgi:hypothetical protein